MPLVAVAVVLLLAAAGLAVDVGYIRFVQRIQQTATDSAAIAGAAELNNNNATAAAKADASSNGFTDSANGVTVTVQNPPQAGPYINNMSAVEVLITAVRPKFFERVFSGMSMVRVSTRAVGLVSANNNGCIYLLDPTQSSNFNKNQLSMPGCGILDNGTGSNMNKATIDAGFIGYAGGAPNTNGATFPHASPAPMLPAADPCNAIPGCNYLTNNPPSASGCTTLSPANNSTISPGCYTSLDVSSKTITFSPGLYIINGTGGGNGGLNADSATLNGSGVTIYVTSSGTLAMNKSIINLNAPTSGNYKNVLFYQVPANTTDPNFNKIDGTMTGLLYFPKVCSVNYNKSTASYTVLVFGCANFNKNGNTAGASPPPNGSIITKPVLVE